MSVLVRTVAITGSVLLGSSLLLGGCKSDDKAAVPQGTSYYTGAVAPRVKKEGVKRPDARRAAPVKGGVGSDL